MISVSGFCCFFCFVVRVVVFVVLFPDYKRSCFPCKSGVLCCNVGSKHVFLFFEHVFVVLFGVLFLEVVLCCLFVKRNTIEALLVLNCFCSSLLLVCLSLSRTNPKTLEKCNINPESRFFS